MKKFTEISKRANDKNWCWNLTCTTCGSIDLMKEFSRIISDRKTLNRFSHSNRYQDQKDLLEKIVDEIDIKELKENVKFPDWLGHIGLLMSSTEGAEKKEKILTKKLIPQFLEMINEKSLEYQFLKDKLENDIALSIRDLGRIERVIY